MDGNNQYQPFQKHTKRFVKDQIVVDIKPYEVFISKSENLKGRDIRFTLLPRLECSGVIIAHWGLNLLCSKSHSVAQTGMQWSDLSSLQPPSPGGRPFLTELGLLRFSCACSQSSAFPIAVLLVGMGPAELD
ncbi:hypothetical protein AAY473_002479 [Plecturocebus cupreus]